MHAAKTALTVAAVAVMVLAVLWAGQMTGLSGGSGSATQPLSLATNNVQDGDVAWIPAGAGIGDPGTAPGGGQAGTPEQALNPASAGAAEAERIAPVSPVARTQTPPGIDAEWLARASAATGIPGRALQAYAAAAAVVARENPSCALGWNTLAGIGYIESRHGTLGGFHVLPDGQVSGRILGPRLDGVNSALIHDTDHGQLDGDTDFDRAVGPLQFIPSTWAIYAVDAAGKGTADPNNMDDAALAAGRYLCKAGGDLGTGAGWQRGVLAYNHSQSYADSVLRAANAYARAVQ